MLSQEVQDVLAIALVDKGLAAEFARLADSAATVVDADSASGQPVLNVASTEGYKVGETIIIDEGNLNEETGVIESIQDGESLTLEANLSNTHLAAGSISVSRLIGIPDKDLERNLEIALADKDAFDEVLAVLKGAGALLSKNAKDVLAIALCDKDATDAVIADLEA